MKNKLAENEQKPRRELTNTDTCTVKLVLWENYEGIQQV